MAHPVVQHRGVYEELWTVVCKVEMILGESATAEMPLQFRLLLLPY